jgi:hypothetical protein
MHFCVRGILRKMGVRVCADRLWSGPRLPKVWETLRVTVHRLETGELLVVGNVWRCTSYYRACVTSAFTWAVRHILSFCHISAYWIILEAAEMIKIRLNLSRYLSVCSGYICRTAVRMRSTIPHITLARFCNGSHAAIRNPGIRVKHWSYGHCVTTLLNPRGVAAVSHKYSLTVARNANAVVAVPPSMHCPDYCKKKIYYFRWNLKVC